jgi:two-component system, LuxR family, secretion system response regulator SsrB
MRNERDTLMTPTPRELEVLELICDGRSTREIAGLLRLSEKTVACHRGKLLEKAAVHDAVHLFRWAIEQGYVSVGRKPTTTPGG